MFSSCFNLPEQLQQLQLQLQQQHLQQQHLQQQLLQQQQKQLTSPERDTRDLRDLSGSYLLHFTESISFASI